MSVCPRCSGSMVYRDGLGVPRECCRTGITPTGPYSAESAIGCASLLPCGTAPLTVGGWMAPPVVPSDYLDLGYDRRTLELTHPERLGRDEGASLRAMLAKANEQLGAALEEVNRLHADHRKAQEVLDALGSDTKDTDLLTSCTIVAGDYRGARSGMAYYRRSAEESEKERLAAVAFADEAKKQLDAAGTVLGKVVCFATLDTLAGESVEEPEHAALVAMLRVVRERDEARADLEKAAKGAMSLDAQLGEALRQADNLRHDFKMYKTAWLRELGGALVPKTHDIDALALTTRAMRENFVNLVAAVETQGPSLSAALSSARAVLGACQHLLEAPKKGAKNG